MVFIPAADSPIGKEILLAAAPLAGRVTAYAIVKEDALRGNDGSCKDTATCPYISATKGGAGTIRDNMDVCSWCESCSQAQKETLGCANAYSFSVTAQGTVDLYTSAKIDSMKAAVANKAGVLTTKVSIDVLAGSVILKVTIRTDTAAALAAVAAAVEPSP